MLKTLRVGDDAYVLVADLVVLGVSQDTIKDLTRDAMGPRARTPPLRADRGVPKGYASVKGLAARRGVTPGGMQGLLVRLGYLKPGGEELGERGQRLGMLVDRVGPVFKLSVLGELPEVARRRDSGA